MNQMSLVTLSDYVIIGADIIMILMVVVQHYVNSKDEKNCQTIVVGPKNLQAWRYALYGAVLSGWLSVFFLLSNPSVLRFVFYIAFPYFTIVTLNISLPAWFCKFNKQSYLCNCDYYTYRDFEIVLLLGTVTGILMITFPQYQLIPIISTFLLVLIYFFIPTKEVDILNYPRELQIENEEQLQLFLMSQSDKRKVILLIHSGCDFCELQINELNELSDDLYENVRILDFTNGSMLNDFFLDYLNIERNYESMQFPATLIIDNGMSFDRRMGILSATEMTMILEDFT